MCGPPHLRKVGREAGRIIDKMGESTGFPPKPCSSLAKCAKDAKTSGAFPAKAETLPGNIWLGFEKEKTNSWLYFPP